MKTTLTVITLGTVGILLGALNRLHRGSRRFNLAEGHPTMEDIDKMSPRQLRRLEREQERLLQAFREHQTC